MKLFNRKSLVVNCGLVCALCLLFFGVANAQGLPVATPNTVGMSAEKLNQIDALVEKDISEKKLPGAVVISDTKGKSFSARLTAIVR